MYQKHVLPLRLAFSADKTGFCSSCAAKFLNTIARSNRLNSLLLHLFLVATVCAQSGVSDRSRTGSEEPRNLVYRSTISEVRLVFFATDEHNHNVRELQRDDFAVVDDERVIREFSSFSGSASVDLDVVVLIDTSESVLPHIRQEIADVAQLISQSPWNPGDKVSLLTFGGMETRLVCAGNCRNSFTADQIIPLGGATPLLDSVEIATTMLVQDRDQEAWPVILLFSDGGDTISKASFNQVREKILNSGAQIYAIDVSSPKRPSEGAAILQSLAADSGGLYARLSEGPARIFHDIIDDLHSARIVTYAPPSSSSDFHAIRILPTHNLNLQFRCRRGYYRRAASMHSEENP